jgi:hypothetical protein
MCVFCLDGLRLPRTVELAERDRRHEAIPTPGNRNNVATIRLPVAQRFAEGCDVNFEASLRDESVRPHASHEGMLADHLAWALDERCQNLESATAEANAGVTLEKKLLGRKEAESAE